FRIVELGNTKIDQNWLIALFRHNDVRWFDITMHDRRLLLMQVGDSIHDRSHNMENFCQLEAFSWLLLSQLLQVRPFNIIQEQVDALLLVVLKYAIDTRQSRMIKLLE